MRGATLRNRELFLQTHRKDERRKELFKGPIHTSRQIKNNLRQNRSKDNFCRVNLCDIYPSPHSNYFATIFWYSSNVYFSFSSLLTLRIVSDKIKGQISSGQFLLDLPMSLFQLVHLILLPECVIQRFPDVESVIGTPTVKPGHF